MSFKKVGILPLRHETTAAIRQMILNMYTPTGKLKRKYRNHPDNYPLKNPITNN